MKTTKRAVSAVLAGSVLLSMSGCSFLDKSDEEVTLAAKQFCNAVTGLDADTIIDMSDDELDDDIAEMLPEVLDIREGDVYTADAADLIGSIAKTLTYEVDEESLEADGKEGTGKIDVTFTMVDAEALLEDDEFDDISDVLDAIPTYDTTDIEMTLKLDKTDDGWKVEGVEDIIEEVYDFMGYRFFFSMGEAMEDYEQETEPGSTGDVELYGASFIGCDEVDYDNNIGYASTDAMYLAVTHAYGTSNGEPDFTGYHAEVILNGDIVATSDDEVFVAVYPGDGALDAGEYEFTFYDPDGNAFWEGSIIVE